MDYTQRAYENWYFPLFERLIKGRLTAKVYKDSLTSQWQSREYLESNQLESLNQLLQHCSKNIPFWKEEGLPPTISDLSALREFPVMTKSFIREHHNQLLATAGVEELWRKSTGGSTGEPLQFAYTRSSYEWRVAMSLRGHGWGGAPPGIKLAHIWGVPISPEPWFARTKQRLHHKVDRRRYYNCFNFSQATMRDCLDDLSKWRPTALLGYTNPTYELARYAIGMQRDLQIPKVLCAAEKVHPLQRKTIADAFSSDVYDTYGSREFMLIASECDAHEGLHVSMENLIVEIVDDNNNPVSDGEVGRVLITDLHNYGMPFIRYEIGDMARATSRACSCGRGLQLIDDVIGRSLDVIKTPDGRTIPGEFFPHLMKDFPEIQRFQVVQEKLDQLHVQLQGLNSIESATLDNLETIILETLGSEVRLTLEPVLEIPLTATGKHRVTISKLDDGAAF